MLEQFVAVMPGTLAPALLVMSLSVMLTVGEGRDKPISSHWRLIGLIVGLIAAIVFAGLRASAVINQRTFVNYPVLWCAIIADILTIVVVVFARRITTNWQQHKVFMHIANAVAAIDIALTLFYALPDVILQLTIWVEPGETAFTSAMLLRALGFLLGVAMSIIVVAIFRTMRTTAVRWAFTVAVAAMMVILLIQHFTGLAQILQARGFPMNHTMFVALAWSINQNSTMIMAQALVFLIPAVASIVAGFRMKTHDVPGANEATLRRHKVFRRHAIAAAPLSPPEACSLKDGVATIPFSQVEDGHLHRFEYKAKDGTVMRFIIIRKNGGAYGIGLDACENCGDAGYYEKDGKIICKKCEVAINLATIGFKGGCNPIPFPYKTGHGKITIQTTDLDALSAHFR